MTQKCTQCGAITAIEETCSERFNRSQVLELEEPQRYQVHHLSVPCYWLQHNMYSRTGWLQVRKLLYRFIYEGLTPQQVLQQNKTTLDSGKRSWSFTRGEKLAGVEDILWTFTISDVRLDNPENYTADVLQWAKQVLDDSENLIRQTGI
jgi:hypothetical protein